MTPNFFCQFDTWSCNELKDMTYYFQPSRENMDIASHHF